MDKEGEEKQRQKNGHGPLLKKITSRHDYVVRRADDKLEAT